MLDRFPLIGRRWRSAAFLTALSAICIPAAAVADAPARAIVLLTGPEFLLQKGILLGRRVEVLHCHLEFADVVPAFCSVYGPDGFAHRFGHIVVDTATMAREARIAGSAQCPGLNQKTECWVDLTGVPSERFSGGEVGTWIEDPIIAWHRP